MDNILMLRHELLNKTYRHGLYEEFKISDPKPRIIHKATVRDRLLHHAIYRILYPFFDRLFISDSYSCRRGKGTYKSVNQFKKYARKVSRNNSRTVWILKGDIRKFFANIDHAILKKILEKYIKDKNSIWVLGEIIDSFSTKNFPEVGLPLGNLTSQLLVNVYMNEFDQFVKHELKARYYIRYADDFVILSQDKSVLEKQLPQVSDFLKNHLSLFLNPDKVFIKTLASGVDFLGWINFPHHRVLRSASKRRMFKKLKHNNSRETVDSYLGLLKHGNTYKLRQILRK
jgi:retron-type reverse transcriptase